MRRWIFRGLWAVLSCLLTVAILVAVKPYLPSPAPTVAFTPVVTVPEPPTQSDTEPELPDNPVDFAALQAEFPEAVAWIRVPDTTIDYAVMQSGPDTKEDYYLDRNEAGEKDRNGSIYIQKYNEADFSDPNTILYGHNMRNYHMFGEVHRFKKANFFNQHEYLYVYTPGHVLKYRICAVFKHNSRHLLWAYDFTTDEGRQTFIDQVFNPKASIQQVRDGVAVTPDDRLVTLSTCLNSREGEGRLLLVAVLVEDMETK